MIPNCRLRMITKLKATDPILAAERIFNGMTNYIFDQMERDGLLLDEGITQTWPKKIILPQRCWEKGNTIYSGLRRKRSIRLRAERRQRCPLAKGKDLRRHAAFLFEIDSGSQPDHALSVHSGSAFPEHHPSPKPFILAALTSAQIQDVTETMQGLITKDIQKTLQAI